VCEGQYQRSHAIHNFSTSTENVQVPKKSRKNKAIRGEKKRFASEMHRNSANGAEEIFGKFLVFSIGAVKLIDAQRIGTNQKALWLDQNDGGVEGFALWSIDLIFRAADSVFVEMDEGVV